jgi:pimeloyl-ACP methyl ester carboxylesterase
MPRRMINGVELYYELCGEGEAVVLVHGSWTDHVTWDAVVGGFAERHRVLTYDRRGHSRSERSPAPGSRRTDEDDLAALVAALELGPVHLVSSSFGSSIAMGLAARRPDLVRSVVAHEPPLLGVAPIGSALQLELTRVLGIMGEVVAILRRGEHARGAERFVDDLVFGPGAWPMLPDDSRRVMVANAPTFVDEFDDAEWADVPAPADPSLPILLTDGDRSPSWFPAIVRELTANVHPDAARHTFAGAGHVPHITHPAELVHVACDFLERVSVP